MTSWWSEAEDLDAAESTLFAGVLEGAAGEELSPPLWRQLLAAFHGGATRERC